MDIWVRTSVVDTDAKSAAKIPEYASQLDEYAEAYYNRFEKTTKENAPFVPLTRKTSEGGKHEAVGGHDDSIKFEGEFIWKKDQGGDRGCNEFAFLRQALEGHREAVVEKQILPRLGGYRVDDSCNGWIGMSNLLHGLSSPAVLDIKMGTRTFNTRVSEKKAASQAKKAAETTSGSLGVRVVGGKFKNEAGDWTKTGYKNDADISDEAQLQELLGRFLNTPALRKSAAAKIKDVQAWWRGQSSTAFYAASLLLAFDTAACAECRVNLIDFANAEDISDKAQDLSGFDVGLETLLRVLGKL